MPSTEATDHASQPQGEDPRVLSFDVNVAKAHLEGNPVEAAAHAVVDADEGDFSSYTVFREDSTRVPAGDDGSNSDGSSRGDSEEEHESSGASRAEAGHSTISASQQQHHVDPEQEPPQTDAAASAKQHRNRSATHVMAFNRNSDPNSSPPREDTSSGGSSLANSPDNGGGSGSGGKCMYQLGAVQIKAASLSDVISKAQSDPDTQTMLQEIYQDRMSMLLHSTTVLSPVVEHAVTKGPPAAKKKGPPTSLPTELKLPMPLRCDFCQKFDSVCSNCHFKWRGIAENRKSAFMKRFHSLFPEHRRIPLYFFSVAYGHTSFVAVLAESLGPQLSELQSEFVPVYCEWPDVVVKFTEAGPVTLLHVACGMRRLDVARMLFEKGVIVRKSQSRISPFDLLPQPVPQDWLDMLQAQPSFEEFTMIERAKRLRAENNFEEALLEYQAVIKMNPQSELARCGIAKTMYDQGNMEECIRHCDNILSDQKAIRWLEHIPESVALLRSEASKSFHQMCHADSSTALRKCGCIIVDLQQHRISIRKLPFRLIRERIFPFCDCAMLWRLWQASRIPLLLSATERYASKHCIESVSTMLNEEFGYAEMYEAISTDKPHSSGSNCLLKPPLRFLGVHVVAMADFHTFLLKASVVGGNPKYSGDSFFSFGKKSEDSKRQRVVATKCFRVMRAGIGKAWEVGDGGEWEVDVAASDALLNAVQQRMQGR